MLHFDSIHFRTHYFMINDCLHLFLRTWLMIMLVFFLNVMPCIPAYPQTYKVAEDELELLILLPLPPDGWDYRCEPPHLVLSLIFMVKYEAVNQMEFLAVLSSSKNS